MATVDNMHDSCDNCDKTYEDGDGISGYDDSGKRKDYCWDCADKLKLEVDEGGWLVEEGTIQ